VCALGFAAAVVTITVRARQPSGSYDGLLKLFAEFVNFERPALKNGAPDYSAAAVAARRVTLKTFQSRLAATDTKGWPIEQQVDHAMLGAMINGLDFDHARAALRARPGVAVRAGEPVRHQAGQGVSGRNDRPRVSERAVAIKTTYFPRSFATGPSTPFGSCRSAS
jgi:hypothetical protein